MIEINYLIIGYSAYSVYNEDQQFVLIILILLYSKLPIIQISLLVIPLFWLILYIYLLCFSPCLLLS